MTRAADRLVIAGARGQNRMPEGCWYQLIAEALKPEAIEDADADGDVVLRWRRSGEIETGAATADEPTAKHGLPDWLTRNVPAESAGWTISPSRTGGGDAARQRTVDAHGLARGRIVHRLLQALPALPTERRAGAARKHLARIEDLDDTVRDAITREVLAILDDARFASLFAPNSRAEVPIVGIVSSGERVSGQVDRLAVTDEEVQIADYKSDRLVPDGIEDVPRSYVRQLALYRAVLQRLYPNHTVRAALIWTAGPTLTELPAALLDAELSRLNAA